MAQRKTTPAANTDADKPEAGPVVQVIGPKAGRRRAGIDFGRDPVAVPLSELSDDQKRALRDDPKLSCAWPDGVLDALDDEDAG